jgi:hypothetical protein
MHSYLSETPRSSITVLWVSVGELRLLIGDLLCCDTAILNMKALAEQTVNNMLNLALPLPLPVEAVRRGRCPLIAIMS